MLALPTTTGLAGFFPALGLFALYWMLLTFTAFLLLEVTLWMDDHTNLITMARRTLGGWGELISWTTYLFLLYALTTAYLAGGSQITSDAIEAITGTPLPSWAAPLPLLVIFGFFVYRGARYVDLANRLLMAGLVICYAVMVVVLAPHVQTDLLTYTDSRYLLLSSSVVATSFGFHIIIPTLATYLKRDVRALRYALLFGSIIPLIVYIVWELLALGIIPLEGPSGIIAGYRRGADGVQLLNGVIGNGAIAMVARFFSFFAIVTSFLGVSLSLRDFLADGFKIKKSRTGKILLYLMTFVPAFLIIKTYPHVFLTALEYAGAFGVMILLAVIPALMVWQGRYKQKLPDRPFRAPGGKAALVAVLAFSTLVIALEIANMVGLTDYFLKQ